MWPCFEVGISLEPRKLIKGMDIKLVNLFTPQSPMTAAVVNKRHGSIVWEVKNVNEKWLRHHN